ncbi:ABC transporter permease [Lentzea aerocolonigenes]|uniref:ABC transporter permease n=1 Tax=Lentzea aerocolonigenes TaxID=68170 RepID=A0A0F0H199_LENAE|nr:branched-chain amino acid ABC transporter permease [Lentzea aerocolonigenes]KJK48616.1 ABC transporter permease [Lentzea aerocolonigenes]
MNLVNAVVQGVLLGGLYALLAAGLSLIFGVMRLVNLAHGAFAVTAAYGSLTLVQHLGWHPLMTLAVVVPVFAAAGFGLQRGVLTRAATRGPLTPLLVTFGLAVIVESLLLTGFSADSRTLPTGQLSVASVRLTGTVSVGVLPLLTFAVGVVAVLGLQWFLFRTPAGRLMRATSDDREAARIVGADDRRVFATATAIALGLVAVAGVFIGMRGTFAPSSGAGVLLFAFETVVIGGLGSLWGTLAGGVLLGVAQLLGAAIDPAAGVLAGHVVFLVVLAVRPEGLFPKAVIA